MLGSKLRLSVQPFLVTHVYTSMWKRHGKRDLPCVCIKRFIRLKECETFRSHISSSLLKGLLQVQSQSLPVEHCRHNSQSSGEGASIGVGVPSVDQSPTEDRTHRESDVGHFWPSGMPHFRVCPLLVKPMSARLQVKAYLCQSCLFY